MLQFLYIWSWCMPGQDHYLSSVMYTRLGVSIADQTPCGDVEGPDSAKQMKYVFPEGQ